MNAICNLVMAKEVLGHVLRSDSLSISRLAHDKLLTRRDDSDFSAVKVGLAVNSELLDRFFVK